MVTLAMKFHCAAWEKLRFSLVKSYQMSAAAQHPRMSEHNLMVWNERMWHRNVSSSSSIIMVPLETAILATHNLSKTPDHMLSQIGLSSPQ